MDSSYKNARQQEFAVLLQRMEDLGFSQADVARILKRTPGLISRYRRGGNPSASLLEMFRMIVEEKEGPKEETEPTDRELQNQLKQLRERSPPDFEVARSIIVQLHNKLPPIINSGSPSGPVERAASGAAPAAMRSVLESQRKRKAGGPTARKDGPASGAGPEKK